jgi:hypothetical protein
MNRTGLAWGIVFVMVGVHALLVDLEIWASQPGWLWPLLLMALGAALLVGGLVPGRRTGRDV